MGAGSLFNFNQYAFDKAAGLEQWAKDHLASAPRSHSDETEINTGGKRQLLHGASNDGLICLAPMRSEASIPPRFTGALSQSREALLRERSTNYTGMVSP